MASSRAAAEPGVRVICVAAIPTPAAEAVAPGLERAAPLVKRAAAEGAELVLLPELMAVHYIFTEAMWDSAEPTCGLTVEWLRDTAKTLHIYLGTSFLEAAGQDFFNTFVLAGPDGEEAGRVRKQTPAVFEPWFFRGETGSHVIRTRIGNVGVGVCNDNHRSYLPALLQREDAALLLMPHCWPLPAHGGGIVSERDIQRWHEIQRTLAPLYARLLGIPAVFVNKVGPFASPAPARWLPDAKEMFLPGYATIADSGGSVKACMSGEEGVITARVALDPARKIRGSPKTYGGYVYPAGLGGHLMLAPAWIGARAYQLSHKRRRRALAVSSAGSAISVPRTA